MIAGSRLLPDERTERSVSTRSSLTSCSSPRHCRATPYDGHTLGDVIAATEKLTG
jgi:hypothetical protein